MTRYETLADEIEAAVQRGVFGAGERVLSVRRASRQYGVSIKTVLHAYALLESRGVIESRPQSGYFVRGRANGHAPGGAAGPAAAGRGTRVGGGLPKQYLPLAGRPLILHTLERLAAHPRVAGRLGYVPVEGGVMYEDGVTRLLLYVLPSARPLPKGLVFRRFGDPE